MIASFVFFLLSIDFFCRQVLKKRLAFTGNLEEVYLKHGLVWKQGVVDRPEVVSGDPCQYYVDLWDDIKKVADKEAVA